nr:MAG TPA: hypothetical protein [Bacteriophage sp.]
MSKLYTDTLNGLKEAVEISKGIPLKQKLNIPDLESVLTDTRLTEPSNRSYKWRDMIEEVKRLGRPLTKEEAERYKVNAMSYDDPSVS